MVNTNSQCYDKFRLDRWIRGGGLKRGAKRRFTGLWVYVMIYQCDFFLRQGEAPALHFTKWSISACRTEKKKNCTAPMRQCANAPELLQKKNYWSALFQKWLCGPCNWHSTWREVSTVVHETSCDERYFVLKWHSG